MYLYTYIWQFFIKLTTPLVYDPPISFLDIYFPKMKLCFNISCTQMFIAALFIAVQNWKQPKCP